MKTVTIQQNKGRLFLYLLMSLAFVAGGIWLWGKADEYTGFNHWKALLGAGICIPAFGMGAFVFTYKLFDQRAGIVLNENGIHRLGLFKYHPIIPWSDVSRCSIEKVRRTRFLHLHVYSRTAPHVIGGALKGSLEDVKKLIENGRDLYLAHVR